jgi:hypothetical protein
MQASKEGTNLDTSNILSIAISILSIIISVIFAITGFLFTRKSDETLSSIQKEVNIQTQQYMHLLEINIKSADEKWSQVKKSDDEKMSLVIDLLKITMEKQISPELLSSRKVDPKSPGSTPRNRKLREEYYEEKQ